MPNFNAFYTASIKKNEPKNISICLYIIFFLKSNISHLNLCFMKLSFHTCRLFPHIHLRVYLLLFEHTALSVRRLCIAFIDGDKKQWSIEKAGEILTWLTLLCFSYHVKHPMITKSCRTCTSIFHFWQHQYFDQATEYLNTFKKLDPWWPVVRCQHACCLLA